MRDPRCTRGQTAPEFLGMLLVVSVIIAAVALTPVGDQIRTEIKRVVCEIAQRSDCDAIVAGVDPECVVSSETRESNISVNIIAVKIGNGATLIKEVYADGRTVFTLVDNAEVAAELIAGVRARAGKIGLSAAYALSAGGSLDGARVFEFDDPDDARAFEEKVRNEGTISDILHGLAEGPSALSFLDPLGIKDGIADLIFGEDADDLPEPTATYLDAKLFLDAGAELAAGIPGLDAELVAAAQLSGGIKAYTSGPQAGQVELHYELEAEAAANLGLLTLGPGITGDASVSVAMTVGKGADGKYRPLKLEVVGTAGYNGAPLQASDFLGQQDLDALQGALESASVTNTSGSGHSVEFRAELDLTDSDNLRAALGILNPSPGGQALAAADLVHRFADDGRLIFQTFDTTATDNGVELVAGAGVNAGFGGGTQTDSQDLASAYVREPGGTWQARRCGQPG